MALKPRAERDLRQGRAAVEYQHMSVDLEVSKEERSRDARDSSPRHSSMPVTPEVSKEESQGGEDRRQPRNISRMARDIRSVEKEEVRDAREEQRARNMGACP